LALRASIKKPSAQPTSRSAHAGVIVAGRDEPGIVISCHGGKDQSKVNGGDRISGLEKARRLQAYAPNDDGADQNLSQAAKYRGERYGNPETGQRAPDRDHGSGRYRSGPQPRQPSHEKRADETGHQWGGEHEQNETGGPWQGVDGRNAEHRREQVANQLHPGEIAHPAISLDRSRLCGADDG
jgi:hypothetical protein